MAIVGPTGDHGLIRGWADRNGFVPAIQLPVRVDGEPAELQLMTVEEVRLDETTLEIGWPDFFAKFDLLRLSFVYDDAVKGYNEILRDDRDSTYQNPAYRIIDRFD